MDEQPEVKPEKAKPDPNALDPADLALLKAQVKNQREQACMAAIGQALSQTRCRLVCEHVYDGEKKTVTYRAVAQ